MSLTNDKFPASAAFDAINAALENEATKKDAKKLKTVFGFTLKNKDGETESWNLDLKDTGKVSAGLGAAKIVLSLSDEDFGKLVKGEANPQKLYMGGKLKVKGDAMKATKLGPILAKAQSPKAKL